MDLRGFWESVHERLNLGVVSEVVFSAIEHKGGNGMFLCLFTHRLREFGEGGEIA